MRPLLMDFGGVFLLTPFELRDHASKALGPLPWAGPFDPATDPEWAAVHAGTLKERTYWADRAAEHGLDTRAFMHHFYNPSGDHLIRPEMHSLLRRHRAAGRTVGMLTNDLNDFHGPAWREPITVLQEFDFIVDGSITKHLKPSPESYRLGLEALGNPDPAEVVFVDDLAGNIEGALAAGITSVRFYPTDVAGSIAAIEAALVAEPAQTVRSTTAPTH
jgi:putative hydrolase of the HAD superfamily